MSLDWVAAAGIIAAASFVQGLAGFGIGLVALAFLPYLMTPATAVALMTLLATVFCCLVFFPLRRDFHRAGVDLCWWGRSPACRSGSGFSPACPHPCWLG